MRPTKTVRQFDGWREEGGGESLKKRDEAREGERSRESWLRE